MDEEALTWPQAIMLFPFWLLFMVGLHVWPGWLIIGLLFAVGCLISEHYKNAGIADVCWSWSLPLATTAAIIWCLYIASEGGSVYVYPHYIVRWGLLGCLVWLSYGRLGWHITRRFVIKWPQEDPRYHAMRQQWQPHDTAWMMGVFALQAGLMMVLITPISWILFGSGHPMSLAEWLALGLGLLSVAGETIADRQLARFQSNPDNKGKICQVGLWHYSRHPNYFFQWLFWVSLAVWATVTHPMGWVGWIAPAMMLHFLLNVTGVKPTEEGMLKSRGEAFREYQRTTSAFIPWFPKKSEGHEPSSAGNKPA